MCHVFFQLENTFELGGTLYIKYSCAMRGSKQCFKQYGMLCRVQDGLSWSNDQQVLLGGMVVLKAVLLKLAMVV